MLACRERERERAPPKCASKESYDTPVRGQAVAVVEQVGASPLDRAVEQRSLHVPI